MDRPTNSRDTIDSREVIEAIEEIEAEIAGLLGDEETIDAADGINVLPVELWPDGIDSETQQDVLDLAEELVPLRKLAAEAEGYAADWEYGEQLIRYSYFREFAEELADDIGCFSVPNDNPYGSQKRRDLSNEWPFRHIDWEEAAVELQQDYTEVQFDGVAYWIR